MNICCHSIFRFIYLFIEKQEFMSISLWSYDGNGTNGWRWRWRYSVRSHFNCPSSSLCLNCTVYSAFAFYTVFIFLTLIAPLRRFRMRKRFVFNHFGHFIWTLEHSWLSFMVHREWRESNKTFYCLHNYLGIHKEPLKCAVLV